MSARFLPLLAFALFALPTPARSQQCLGRPIEAGEHTAAVRVDLDRSAFLAGEYSGVSDRLAWSAFAGGATEELVPPGDFAPVFGAGVAYTGGHRAICPALSGWTFSRETESFSERSGNSSFRRSSARVGIAIGRRLGEDRMRGAAFVFPHGRWLREDTEFGEHHSDEVRREWWVEGGFSLRGERLWGRATLGLQVGGYSPGEDTLDGSLGFSAGLAF